MKSANIKKHATNTNASFFDSDLFKGLLLFVMVMIAYIPGYFAGFIWDDLGAILDNQLLHSGEGFVKIWTTPTANPSEAHYWPIVYTVFWIQYHIWGLNPFGYHFVNIFLQALDTVLLWLVVRRFFPTGAWIIAAIFGVHPVHVESVVWTVELKDVLSGAFYLSSILMFFNFGKSKKWLFYILSLLLFILAMLSKSSTIGLPIALLLYLWWKKDTITKRDILSLLPFFIVAGILAYVDLSVVQLSKVIKFNVTPLERILIASRAIWFYAWKFIFPIGLITFYPKWQNVTHSVISYVSLAALIGVIIFLFIKKRQYGKAPLALVLFFIFSLAPILSFIDFNFMEYSYVADRFQYLASIGLTILLIAAVNKKWGYLTVTNRPKVQFIGALFLVVLGFLTFQQSKIYKDKESLFRHNIVYYPESSYAQFLLGEDLQNKGEYDEALVHLKKAIEINPKDTAALNNIGVILAQTGKVDEGIKYLRESARIEPDSPSTYANLGNALLLKGDADGAIREYMKGYKLDPKDSLILANIGNAYINKGSLKEAISFLRKALEKEPDNPISNCNLGFALSKVGDPEEAIKYFRKSLEINPNYMGGRSALADFLKQQGKLIEAQTEYFTIIKAEPSYTKGYVEIANIYYRQGKMSEATEYYQKALEVAKSKGEDEIAQKIQQSLDTMPASK